MEEYKNAFQERLHLLIKEKNLNRPEFGKETNMTDQRLKHYFEEGRIPDVDAIQKILGRYPEINPFWLILGKGTMYCDGFAEIPFDILMEGEIPYGHIRPPFIGPSARIRKRILDVIGKEPDYTLLSKQTQIPSATLESQISGKAHITIKVIKAICAVYPSLSYNWLLTGNPDTYSESKYINRLLEKLIEVLRERAQLLCEIEQLKQQNKELQDKGRS